MFLTKRKFVFIILLLAVFLLGCAGENGKSEPESGKLKAVATIFPLYEFAHEIGGENADVSLLLPPGADAHSFEPKPSDIEKISRADIFIYAGDSLEPWAERVLAGAGNPDAIAIDASRAANASTKPRGCAEASDFSRGWSASKASGGSRLKQCLLSPEAEGFSPRGFTDPHFWLDFEGDKKAVRAIAEALAEKDGKNAGYYEENAQRYSRALDALDEKYSLSLANCGKSTILLAGHNAFLYLAGNYGFEIVSTSGFSPEGEPTPKRMGELFRRGKEEGIKYVFFEPFEGEGDASAVAQEIGGTILPLNPAASITSGESEKETFISIMEKNLENLKEGLECGAG